MESRARSIPSIWASQAMDHDPYVWIISKLVQALQEWNLTVLLFLHKITEAIYRIQGLTNPARCNFSLNYNIIKPVIYICWSNLVQMKSLILFMGPYKNLFTIFFGGAVCNPTKFYNLPLDPPQCVCLPLGTIHQGGRQNEQGLFIIRYNQWYNSCMTK